MKFNHDLRALRWWFELFGRKFFVVLGYYKLYSTHTWNNRSLHFGGSIRWQPDGRAVAICRLDLGVPYMLIIVEKKEEPTLGGQQQSHYIC